MIYLCVIIFSVFTITAYADPSSQDDDNKFLSNDKKLFSFLTSRTNPLTRPVFNISEIIKVYCGVSLIRIHDVLWKDIDLRWNPEDFGGIERIRLPTDKIWTPDIVLVNFAEDSMHYQEALAVISSDGNVNYIPPAIILKSTCTFDMTRFPYDTQHCVLIFGSWAYDGFEIDVEFYDGYEKIIETDFMNTNTEWNMQPEEAKKNVKYYPCCPNPYPSLVFDLKLTRNWAFHSLVYVTPLVLIAIICPMIFLLPYSETQRFSLGGSLMICLTILLSSFENVFPATNRSLPAIGQYYIAVIILLTISLALSAAITNMATRTSRPHRILKTCVLDILGRILCVARSPEDQNKMENGETETRTYNEWRAMAQALDRFFFVIYIVITVIFQYD